MDTNEGILNRLEKRCEVIERYTKMSADDTFIYTFAIKFVWTAISVLIMLPTSLPKIILLCGMVSLAFDLGIVVISLLITFIVGGVNSCKNDGFYVSKKYDLNYDNMFWIACLLMVISFGLPITIISSFIFRYNYELEWGNYMWNGIILGVLSLILSILIISVSVWRMCKNGVLIQNNVDTSPTQNDV